MDFLDRLFRTGEPRDEKPKETPSTDQLRADIDAYAAEEIVRIKRAFALFGQLTHTLDLLKQQVQEAQRKIDQAVAEASKSPEKRAQWEELAKLAIVDHADLVTKQAAQQTAVNAAKPEIDEAERTLRLILDRKDEARLQIDTLEITQLTAETRERLAQQHLEENDPITRSLHAMQERTQDAQAHADAVVELAEALNPDAEFKRLLSEAESKK